MKVIVPTALRSTNKVLQPVRAVLYEVEAGAPTL